MKSIVEFLVFIVPICFLLTNQSSAQDTPPLPDRFSTPAVTPHLPNQLLFNRTIPFRIPGKKVSQYTAKDWGKVIDSTWGQVC